MTIMDQKAFSRRSFLIGSIAAGGGIVMGFDIGGIGSTKAQTHLNHQ